MLLKLQNQNILCSVDGVFGDCVKKYFTYVRIFSYFKRFTVTLPGSVGPEGD